jgi:hypothetical protein
MGRQYRDIVKSRYLAERSYLYFQYPGKEGYEFYLPMIENAEVSESQSANYAQYNTIGRSGSLYSYLGANSRELRVKFNITLPNIVDYVNNVGLDGIFSEGYRKTKHAWDKSKFERSTNDFTNNNFYEKAFTNLTLIDPSFAKPSRSQNLGDLFTIFKKVFGDPNKDLSPQNRKAFNDVTMGEAVNYLIMWINVIRTSTINHSSQTNLGPPTVFLNHGTLYNNIPCVCKSYDLRINTPVGYELMSLTPRQIEVSLSLSENRTGNFKDFQPFKFVEGHNLAGWESVIDPKSYGSLDPNNGIFEFSDFL